MLTIGTKVKTQQLNKGPESFYLGTIVGTAKLGGSDRYVVEVESEIWNGEECLPQIKVAMPAVDMVQEIQGVTDGQ